MSNYVTLLHIFDFVSQVDADLAGFDGFGWYFWDETQSHCHGPFDTPQDAEKGLATYVKEYL